MISQILDYIGRENIEELALSSHVPQEATYILVSRDGTYKAVNERRVAFNSKYCLMDFYSRVISSNKSVTSKNIFSNNYLSFFCKSNVPQNDILNYYRALDVPPEYKWCEAWILENLSKIWREYKGFVKIFFLADPELFRMLGMENWYANSITFTKFSKTNGAPICYNANPKKMYCKNAFSTYLTDNQTGLEIKLLYDFFRGCLMNDRNMLYIYENGIYATNVKLGPPNFNIDSCIFLVIGFNKRGALCIKDCDCISYSPFLGSGSRVNPPSKIKISTPSNLSIGNKIMQLRKQAGYSRSKFAKEVGIPLRTLENWEYGTRRPSIDGLNKIAEFLNVTLEDIYKE